MTISDQIDALQKEGSGSEEFLRAKPEKETNEQVKAHLSHAKADIDARQSAAKDKAEQATDRTQSQWKSMKADADAKVQAMHDRVDRKRDEHDVKKAGKRRRRRGARRRRCPDYAAWAVDQAQLAVRWKASRMRAYIQRLVRKPRISRRTMDPTKRKSVCSPQMISMKRVTCAGSPQWMPRSSPDGWPTPRPGYSR